MTGAAGVYETPAGMVRTGQVIKVPVDGYRRSLEVDYPIRAVHTYPNGHREPVVWFAGWSAADGHITRGWGQHPDTLVLVIADLRGSDSYLALNGDLLA